ncbi:DgyrCDS13753 [Dimorphilus gyrociliatus]|uniref:Tetraspanin n=2 Tax=Dimorphilus gyrociliatus TaxID=2664684 RepID=A0A7I8WBV2_9ANNE|nr:DgyrCDS13753 [Dimorphilus gyrociliatus]
MGFGSMGCGTKCAKYILFFFNIIFFIAGAALLGVGIWMKVDKNFNKYLDVIKIDNNEKTMQAAIILVIVIGAIIFLTGFLGCCGAIQESSCLLMMYAFIMGLLLLAEITAAILAAVFRKELGNALKENMQKFANTTMKPLEPTNNDVTVLAWSSMQNKLKCCGSHSYTDYNNNPNFENRNHKYPQSCCSNKKESTEKPDDPNSQEMRDCFNDFENNNISYKDGCYDALKKWVEDRAAILIGIGVGIAVIQILGIVFACCVRNAVNKKDVMA